MRAFIAIELPDEVKGALRGLTQRLRTTGAKASWVRPENMHLTLRFLGEATEETVNRIAERLALAYQDVTPFTVTVTGTGAFPNLRKPRVVWAGVAPLEGGLEAAQAVAEAAAAAVGLPPETKRFRPHLTLARIRDGRVLGALPAGLAREKDFAAGAFTVASVSLLSSQLTPSGPIHRRVREFFL